ncbi:MAG: treS, partial [Microbacteriaceae bacterium]|nr:treS [Microbacteriaceae bacterium]
FGEELGMGENPAAGDRKAVRTPMQWTSGVNGGFSNAAAKKLPSPVVIGGFSPEHVNVSDQRHDPDSMLHFMRRLVERYRSSPEMGWGQFEVVKHEAKSVLVHSLEGVEGRMVALHNFSGEGTTVTFRLRDVTTDEVLVDLLVDGQSIVISDDGSATIALDGYGYRWLRLIHPAGKRLG